MKEMGTIVVKNINELEALVEDAKMALSNLESAIQKIDNFNLELSLSLQSQDNES